MSETIALFGGTGSTGQHFLTLALEAGYKVNILVRNPSKVTITSNNNDNLTVIEGDFSNHEAIKKTIQGATYVVSMAGGPMGKVSYGVGCALLYLSSVCFGTVCFFLCLISL